MVVGVIPAKAGIQKKKTGFRITCGMTDVRISCNVAEENCTLKFSAFNYKALQSSCDVLI